MKRYHLTNLIQFFCRIKCFHTIFFDYFFRAECVVSIHFHSETFGNTGYITTYVSISMNTQFLAHQFCTGSSVIEVTDSIYHHTQSKFGNSIRVLSRSVHHTYVVSSGSSQVNVVISRTGTYYDFQFFGSIKHLCINNIATDNDSISIFHCIQQLSLICIFLK